MVQSTSAPLSEVELLPLTTLQSSGVATPFVQQQNPDEDIHDDGDDSFFAKGISNKDTSTM